MNKKRTQEKSASDAAILSVIKSAPGDEAALARAVRSAAGDFGVSVPQNAAILETYRRMAAAGELKPDADFERLLRRRAVRTLSGVAPVAVLTKPYACPGKCAYCPHEPDVPTSYLSTEPAVMRAIRCHYDPYRQVQERLRALIENGHEPEKIELIVIGGSWSALPRGYRTRFIRRCFEAANEFHPVILSRAKDLVTKRNHGVSRDPSLRYAPFRMTLRRNEKAKYRIIGITVETRPDMIDEKEILFMRELGVTRVELGVQTLDDATLKRVRRGHDVAAVAKATALLRRHGIKITYHLMPGLPGATPKKDLAVFKQLFSDPCFQPDQLKFYPTVVTRGSLLYRWWKEGKYKPYTTVQLSRLIAACKAVVPPYVRIIRLIRDIPGTDIVAGNRVTNLRQVLQQQGTVCRCIRCREVRGEQLSITNYELRIMPYEVSGGNEYFISYESKDKKTLYGFCRLFVPDGSGDELVFSALKGAAIVRELHVYGELVPVKGKKKVQHAGLGGKLLAEAERIARADGLEKIAVIAGVGVRGYYRRFGYRLRETYMVKPLTTRG